jgi:restriction endonuclease Mrr
VATQAADFIVPEELIALLQSTPDASTMILQTADNILNQAETSNGELSLIPLSTTPATDWSLNGRGEILMQSAQDGTFQILDTDGEVIQTFTPYQGQPLNAQPTGAVTLIDMDW